MGNKVQGSKKVSSRVKAAGVKDRLSGGWGCRPPLPRRWTSSSREVWVGAAWGRGRPLNPLENLQTSREGRPPSWSLTKQGARPPSPTTLWKHQAVILSHVFVQAAPQLIMPSPHSFW